MRNCLKISAHLYETVLILPDLKDHISLLKRNIKNCDWRENAEKQEYLAELLTY